MISILNYRSLTNVIVTPWLIAFVLHINCCLVLVDVNNSTICLFIKLHSIRTQIRIKKHNIVHLSLVRMLLPFDHYSINAMFPDSLNAAPSSNSPFNMKTKTDPFNALPVFL